MTNRATAAIEAQRKRIDDDRAAWAVVKAARASGDLVATLEAYVAYLELYPPISPSRVFLIDMARWTAAELRRRALPQGNDMRVIVDIRPVVSGGEIYLEVLRGTVGVDAQAGFVDGIVPDAEWTRMGPLAVMPTPGG